MHKLKRRPLVALLLSILLALLFKQEKIGCKKDGKWDLNRGCGHELIENTSMACNARAQSSEQKEGFPSR